MSQQTHAQDEAPSQPDSPARPADRRPNPLGPPFEQGLFHLSGLQVRVNPAGLALVTETGYRWLLFDSDHLLLQTARLDVGLDGRVSPVNASAGPFVEVVPVAFLKLRATLRPTFYWGILGTLLVVDDVSDDWSPEGVQAVADADLGRAAAGLLLTLDATLQAKVGPVIALFENHYWQFWMNVDGPFLEGRFYLLMEPNDAVWTLSTTLGVLIQPDPDDWFLVPAARYDRMRTRVHGFERDLLGGALVWGLPRSWWAWGHPTVAALVQAYVDDPWREGEVTAGAQLTLQF